MYKIYNLPNMLKSDFGVVLKLMSILHKIVGICNSL